MDLQKKKKMTDCKLNIEECKLSFPNAERNSIFFSFPLEIIKTPDTQTDTIKTVKFNNDNVLQTRTTRIPVPIKQLEHKQGKLLCINISANLNCSSRININTKILNLLQAAKM